MKKSKAGKLAAAVAALLMIGALAGCGGTGESGGAAAGAINVVSREDGSGTRGAFVELFGIEETQADGTKVDQTKADASITNSTAVMMTNVAGDPNAIGYLSLGSLDGSVKAVAIDGAEATTEHVKDGSYPASRPFNIVTKDGLSDAAQDFISFILSSDGQSIVEENKYIAAAENAQPYEGSKPSGKITIVGSSSVSPVMESLKEAYLAVNANAQIEIQTIDSTTGITSVQEGVCDIGMASRELKEEEASSGLTATAIAVDGIAVIVNNGNTVDGLTSAQVKAIYTGAVTDWSQIA